MDATIKRAWIDALRSGHYEQGREYLFTLWDPVSMAGGHCVYGVLCELAADKGVIPPCSFRVLEEVKGEILTVGQYGKERAEGYIPEEVARWAGLDPGMALEFVFPESGEAPTTLMALNDDGWTFKVLADLIERFF